MAIEFQKHRKTILHLAFWAVYASFFLYQLSTGRRGAERGWDYVLGNTGIHVGSVIIISYINYFLFLPRLLKNKNIWRYLAEFLPVFLLMSFVLLQGKRWIIDGFTGEEEWVYDARFAVYVILSALFVVIFVGLLKFVENYLDLEDQRKEMLNEQLTSELRFLRAQINPHFLFNTLNNLYYLASNQSPHTPEIIAKLSQMMRYMLHDSNHERVPLKKELAYMENYIELEQLRLNESVPISYKVTGNTDNVRILPLVFITFLENAFKHGVNNTSKDSWIKVSVHIEGNDCVYEVANSKVPEKSKTVTSQSGIGLQNVKRRLDLSYAGKHQLEINDTEEEYFVRLKLDLA